MTCDFGSGRKGYTILAANIFEQTKTSRTSLSQVNAAVV